MSPLRLAEQTNRAAGRSIVHASVRVAVTYAIYASAWILLSDVIVANMNLPAEVDQVVNSTKGLLFVLVTAVVLFLGLFMQMARLRSAENELHIQEARIRQAYVDVLSAVTGGRLVLVTEPELEMLLGEPVLGPERIEEGSQLAGARNAIRSAVSAFDPEVADSMELASAVGEALTNTLKHAGKGTYGVCRSQTMVQVRVDDEGPGIDFRTLPNATLVSGFSTTSTMGLGFTLMLQLSDRVLLVTRPGRTTVVLEFARTGVASHDPDGSAARTDDVPIRVGG